MPEHYPKSTVEVSHFCRTCNRFTMHNVFDGRLGRCQNDHAVAPQLKRPENTQGSLFGEQTKSQADPG
jgi:ribosomal protein L44E